MDQPTWIGRSLGGRYRIDAMLGQGGMSAVYKATDPNLKRVVAIKLIHPHLSIDPTFVQRFESEAAAVASLRHPNIVQVFDFNSDNGVYYMVLEFIPGETLQDRLKRLSDTNRRLSVEEALKFTANIADAVGYSHQRGMVHRDIKPANIMLDVQGQGILMDFGIVKIMGGDSHTSTGAVVGTARYMSPEIIRGEVADHRADIYSLGVTLYEMLSGRPPFMADSAMTLMMMHLNDPVPDVRGFRPDIQPEIVGIIQKCLAKDRNARYQSAAELSADLKNALLYAGGQATTIQPKPAAPKTVEMTAIADLPAHQHTTQSKPVTAIKSQPKPAAQPRKSFNWLRTGLVAGSAMLLTCVVLGVGLYRNLSNRQGTVLPTNSPTLSSTVPATEFSATTAPTLQAIVSPTQEELVTVQHLLVPVIGAEAGAAVFDVDSSGTGGEGRAPYGDSYKLNLFERPFSQDMTYIPDMDIKTFNIRQDDDWYYVTIELIGTDPNNPLGIHYGVELDKDKDGFGDFLILAKPPYTVEWSARNIQIFADENLDSGGRSATLSDAPFSGDGYETLISDIGQGIGGDPDLAWVRLSGDNLIQFAFKRDWAGEVFMFSVFSDAGLKDVTQFDYADRFTETEAGSPVRSSRYFPVGSLFAVDTTCREAVGFASTGYEPRVCPRIVPATGPQQSGGDSGGTTVQGCQPPPGGCPMDAPNWWPDPHCACSFTPYTP